MRPTPELAQQMRSQGLRPRLAWVHEPGRTEEDAKERKRRKARERQRRQTERDTTKWARCYAKAPDDDDARALVNKIARAIADPEIRRAVRLALENPPVVFLGFKVFQAEGFRRWLLRRLLT